jgi:hypothetical protein
LLAAINRFIAEYNVHDAKRFIWKADPDETVAARNREFKTLESTGISHVRPSQPENCVSDRYHTRPVFV